MADDYGFFGPNYSFDNSIPLPGQLNVRNDPSFDAIFDNVGAMNYYVDTIAFGSPTFLDKNNPQPLGIRYFLNTGMKCSNGATMSEYFDGVTRGDLLGDHIAAGLASAGLPGLRGLGPGILENARDALDPRPIFSALSGTGYPVCQQVTCPVGDVQGRLKDATTGSQVILGDVEWINGVPQQRRWVQAYNPTTDSAIQVTKDEFGAQPKCWNADGTYMSRPPSGCPTSAPPTIQNQGTGRYSLCTVTQPATMPPSLPATTGEEGFGTGPIVGENNSGLLNAVSATAILLGGIGLFLLFLK